MSYDECWNNSINKYLAIMDTRTDYIPALVDEVVESFDRECEGNEAITLILKGDRNGNRDN